MSASCDMTINFHGSDEEFEKLLNKMYEIEGTKPGAISIPNWPFTVNDHTIIAYNGACRNIWGSNYLEPEVDMFLELAKVVPDAEFDVSSYRLYEGGGGGCETYIKVEYKNRRLEFKSQNYVDSMTLFDLCASMCVTDDYDTLVVVPSGKTKLFESREEQQDYLEEYGAEVKGTVNNKTDFVICNNPDSTAKTVTMAKALGVPVISEMQFVRMFGDIYEFDDPEQMALIISDLTYEEFCEHFEVDETVTKERFEELVKDPDGDAFVVHNDNEISFEGPWDIEVYELNDDGEFEETE